jgi:hypothetical protein
MFSGAFRNWSAKPFSISNPILTEPANPAAMKRAIG